MAISFAKSFKRYKFVYLFCNVLFYAEFLQSSEKQIEAMCGKDVSVRAVPFGASLIRMVLNHHVTAEMVDLALQKTTLVIQEYN